MYNNFLLLHKTLREAEVKIIRKENIVPEYSPFILDIPMISLPLHLTTLSGGSRGLMSIQEMQERLG
jgi:hypothetical protein